VGVKKASKPANPVMVIFQGIADVKMGGRLVGGFKRLFISRDFF
jgi:hypothetical protein